MANPEGESNDRALKLDFDRRLMLQFVWSRPMQDCSHPANSTTQLG
jgi:hypothetical protein